MVGLKLTGLIKAVGTVIGDALAFGLEGLDHGAATTALSIAGVFSL